jgi:hypothetical protein
VDFVLYANNIGCFQSKGAYWYHQATKFQFEFMLHIVVDVVIELNKLYQKFQYNLVDISTIGSTLVINFYFKEAFSKWSRDLNLDD